MLKYLWKEWVDNSGTNLFKITGKTVWAKIMALRTLYGSKRNTGSRNDTIIFPIQDQRHDGFKLSDWENIWLDFLVSINAIEFISACDIKQCPFAATCEYHKVKDADKLGLAEAYPWHEQFQQLSSKFSYPTSNLNHIVCGVFAGTDQHKARAQKPPRDIYVTNDRTNMKRHLFQSTSHSIEPSYNKALMLSSIYIL